MNKNHELDTIVARVSTLEQQQKNAGDNSALQSQIQEQLDDFQSQINGNAGSIEFLNIQQTQMQTQIQEQFDDFQSQINGNAGSIEFLNIQQTQMQTQIQEQLDDFQSQINGNAGSIEFLAIQQDQLSTQIQSLENQIQSGGGGNTGGGNNQSTSPDNFGTKYYAVEDISALLNDYTTESFFGNQSIAKWPVCAIDENGPQTQVFFRLNPLFTQKPHIKLWFWLSVLPDDLTEIPCVITLNGAEIFNQNLAVLAQDHTAFVEFDIDPSAFSIEMFNTLNIHLNTTALATSFWDWIKVEISNAHNPIVLNRNTDYEIYGLRKSAGGHRIFSSKYNEDGRWGFIGGDDPTLEDDYIFSQEYESNTIQKRKLKWATRTPQQNMGTNSFVYTLGHYLEYYINQDNKFFIRCTYTSFSDLNSTADYISNVRYAKKSLHNGKNEDVECACLTFFDFSIGLVYGNYYLTRPDNFLTTVTFNFNGENYPKEFVDFIPVYDHNKLGQKRQKVSCGYFLHHKSGNILFVPETQSTYFIKVGKGRQVHAFLSQDNLKICVFFQVGNNVVQKTLTRENEESEWTLTNNVEYYYNFEDIVPFQEFYYTIKNRDIQKVTTSLI